MDMLSSESCVCHLYSICGVVQGKQHIFCGVVQREQHSICGVVQKEQQRFCVFVVYCICGMVQRRAAQYLWCVAEGAEQYLWYCAEEAVNTNSTCCMVQKELNSIVVGCRDI
jgi:hypothetical protein